MLGTITTREQWNFFKGEITEPLKRILIHHEISLQQIGNDYELLKGYCAVYDCGKRNVIVFDSREDFLQEEMKVEELDKVQFFTY